MNPKKQLGQNWLHDDDALDAMVDAADVRTGDAVLEVGPGLGTLTEKLLVVGARVYAVEFDRELVPNLRNKFAKESHFFLEQADILKYKFEKLPPGYKVVANIPYYLTSNLLRTLMEQKNHFSQAALLVQKEVAARVCANPGEMSLLSVSVQLYCEPSLGEIVPAALFTPPPKVDSQILKLRFRDMPLFPELETEKFFRIVKAGFGERRKMLHSSISGGLGITKAQAAELLLSASINPELRAQALSLQDWYRLYEKHKYTCKEQA